MLAPSEISSELQQRTITLPKNRELWAAVNGALATILGEAAWEDNGDVTASQIEQLMNNMMAEYVASSTDV